MNGTNILPFSRQSVINDRYLRRSDLFDKRHRLTVSLLKPGRGNSTIESVPVKPQRFKMRVKQLQIAQQFTPEYYLQKHLPTVSGNDERAYFSPISGCISIRSPSVLSTKQKSAKNTTSRISKSIDSRQVKESPFSANSLFSGEQFRKKVSIRRKVRNAVESNKSLLIVSSICFLAGTLILISSFFTSSARTQSSSSSPGSNNTSINDDGSDPKEWTGSAYDQSDSSNRRKRITSMTLFGFIFIGIGFSILCLSLFLIVCCHVNKWLAIKRRPSTSKKLRSDSVTSLISRRKRSIEDPFTVTKISPEPSPAFLVRSGVPSQVHKHQGFNSSNLVGSTIDEPHEVNNVTLVDIEDQGDEGDHEKRAGEEDNLCNKSAGHMSASSSVVVTTNRSHPATISREIAVKNDGEKKEKLKGMHKTMETNDQKKRIRERGWRMLK